MSTRTELEAVPWAKAASPWRDVPAENWNDVAWQLKNLVRTPEQLTDLLGISAHEVDSGGSFTRLEGNSGKP
jgi:L-lysine 2,3-aminomutase